MLAHTLVVPEQRKPHTLHTASRLKHDAYVCVRRQHCWINTPCWVSRLQNMHGELQHTGVGKNTLYENTDYSALPPRGRHYTGMAIFRWGVVVTHFRRKNTHGTHTKTVGIRRRQYGGCGTRQTHGGSSRFAKKNRDYVVGPRLRSVQ
uniref:(northern house mosquito) hypothetical protein n=1 Tax=Culex pipiens TaxID=7175 RepID=A0A8D8MSP4_CULPI